MRFASVSVLVVAAVLFVVSPAEAQHRRHGTPTPTPAPQAETPPAQTPPTAESASRDQEARMLFEAGRVAYAAGRFDDALGYFQHAYEMSGRAVLLYNVASAADKLRRDAVALDAFRRYLEAVPSADNRDEVESRIRVLEQVSAAEQTRAVPVVTVPTDTSAHPTDGSEAAHEGAVNASLHAGEGPGDQPRDGGRSGLLGQWWFWTIVGVVVVGATIGIVAAATSGGGLGPFQSGDDGSVYMTLGMP